MQYSSNQSNNSVNYGSIIGFYLYKISNYLRLQFLLVSL